MDRKQTANQLHAKKTTCCHSKQLLHSMQSLTKLINDEHFYLHDRHLAAHRHTDLAPRKSLAARGEKVKKMDYSYKKKKKKLQRRWNANASVVTIDDL